MSMLELGLLYIMAPVFIKLIRLVLAMNLHNNIILVFNDLSCEQLEAICNTLSLNVE